MTEEFTQTITENNVIYQVKFELDKHGKKKPLSKEVIGYKKSKQPKQPKFTGKSKKNNYTPSPTTNDYNSKRPVYKNISSQPKKDKEAFNAVITYIADLHDKKNKNEEIVELIYNDRENPQKTATTKEDKLELADKAYDDFLADCSIKRQGKREKRTISKHSMFSLPPSLKLDISREQQAKILQETIIKTIDEMEEFKDHKYLIAIHEDQINSDGGVHCHLVMEYHNKNGHSLKMPNVTALKQRNNEFKRKMVFNLYKDHDIKLDSTEKPPFSPNLHKELTFLEITKDNRVLVVDKLGEIRELKFKGAKDKAIDLNLKLGDKFDYITTKEPKLDKDGNQIYINNKPQYKNIYSLGNKVTQEQMQEQIKQIQEQIIENRPENKLAREIEAGEKEIEDLNKWWRVDKLWKEQEIADKKEEIKNKKLAKFIIENKDTIANLSETDITLTYYAYNSYTSSDEKKQIIEQAPHIKHTYTIGVEFPKVAQYLDDDIRKNIRERIVNPYKAIDKAINEEMEKNAITFKHLQKSDKQKAQQKIMQKALIKCCPNITQHNKGLKQLQEKEEREHKQYIESFIARHKTPDKSNERKQDTEKTIPTRTIPPKPKEKEKDIGW